jgi:DinB superfamily
MRPSRRSESTQRRPEVSAVVDPVQNPQAYQTMLIDLVGDDDPAVVQASTSATLREVVAAADADLRSRPAQGEWSVIELLGHMVDAEIISSARYRWVIAEDRPPLVPYDQDLWVAALDYNDADPDDLLATFDALRVANIALWRRSSAAQRARDGIHAERGPESFDLMFRLLAGHSRFHIDQMHRTLVAIRATTPVRA